MALIVREGLQERVAELFWPSLIPFVIVLFVFVFRKKITKFLMRLTRMFFSIFIKDKESLKKFFKIYGKFYYILLTIASGFILVLFAIDYALSFYLYFIY